MHKDFFYIVINMRDWLMFVMYFSITASTLGISCGAMTKALNCDFEVSKFELQSCYYVFFLFFFRANTLRKGMKPPMAPAMG